VYLPGSAPLAPDYDDWGYGVPPPEIPPPSDEDFERYRRTEDKAAPRPTRQKATKPPLSVTWIDQIEVSLETNDFVQGLLCEGSAAVVYGESNAGKTFWTTDLSLHVAAGMTWNGRRVEQGGVIYCVLEGSRGFRNRVAAWRARNKGPCHFGAIESSLNLLNPQGDVDELIDLIRDTAGQLSVPVRMIVIDTLSRALAGGNENAPEDMGALVRNMDRIRAETGACILFVHHSGKDQARGMRGHSLLRAAIDTEIEVVCDEATGARQACVEKQRDLQKGDIFGFTLETEVLGKNRHGEKVTTCVVSHSDEPQTHLRKGGKVAPAAAVGLRALTIAISKHGSPLPASAEYPSNTVAVSASVWRDEFYQLNGKSTEANKKAFQRCEKYLLADTRITQRNGLVWQVRPGQ
jgi:hypothetical protein